MLHPELRQQLGRDHVAALAKAAEERCRTTQVTSASQERRGQPRKPRLEPRTSAAPDATTT
jgi:hypothetical protein